MTRHSARHLAQRRPAIGPTIGKARSLATAPLIRALLIGATAMVLVGNAYVVRRARIRQFQRLRWNEHLQAESQDSHSE